MTKKFKVNHDFVQEWFSQTRKKNLMIDAKSRAVFLKVLEVFEENGSEFSNENLPSSKIKFLFDGIYEIRVKQFRLAYFWYGSTCVLLHGIKKKQDKWSPQDKEVAKKRKDTYLAHSK